MQKNIELTTEERILIAAEKEFLEKGFTGARTISIADAAGVTHAMLHYYFRTKEKLFSQVISNKISEIARTFQIEIDSDKPINECLRKAIESHFNFVKSNPSLPRFMILEVLGNSERLNILQNRIKAIGIETIGKLQAKINESAEAGLCKKIDAFSLLIDIASLNVFPILAINMFKQVSENVEDFLAQRLENNIQTILNKIKL